MLQQVPGEQTKVIFSSKGFNLKASLSIQVLSGTENSSLHFLLRQFGLVGGANLFTGCQVRVSGDHEEEDVLGKVINFEEGFCLESFDIVKATSASSEQPLSPFSFPASVVARKILHALPHMRPFLS